MKRLIWILPLMIMGCPPSGQQRADVKPEATVSPNVEISGQLGTLDQKITQMQTTMTTMTSNYQRDAEQAKTDRRIFGALLGLLGATTILGFCTNKCLTGYYRMGALGVAALLVLGGGWSLMR